MILVTGATGLVGSHLLVQILQENEEKAFFRSENKLKKVKNVFAFYHQTALLIKSIGFKVILQIFRLWKLFLKMLRTYIIVLL